jgi:hypothetical protein
MQLDQMGILLLDRGRDNDVGGRRPHIYGLNGRLPPLMLGLPNLMRFSFKLNFCLLPEGC